MLTAILFDLILWGLVLWISRKPRPNTTEITQTSFTSDVIDAEIVPYNPQQAPVIKIDTRSARQTEPAPRTIETRTVRKDPDQMTGVSIPFRQAVITTVMVTVGVGALAWGLGWSARVVLVVFGISTVVSWFWRLGLADGLVWNIENLTNTDLNHDGAVGKPSYALLNPWQAKNDAAAIVRTTEQDSRADELIRFYRTCATIGTSEGKLGVKPSPAARAAYTEKRDTLLALGVARWKDSTRPRLGWEVTLDPQQAETLIRRHVMALRY